jgi:hypothetical protein
MGEYSLYLSFGKSEEGKGKGKVKRSNFLGECFLY